LRYITVDQDDPNSVLTNRFGTELPNMWFVDDADWDTDMQDMFWGEATDYLTRVDSVRYSVWDSLNNAYWNGAGWDPSSGEIWNVPDQYRFGGGWFTPDSPPHAPGIDNGIGDVLEWKTAFDNPGFGYYKVRSKCWDDLGHGEPGFDDENEKVLIFDNCAPVVHPRYPDAGAVYYIWDWVDSMVVYAWDSCGFDTATGQVGAPVDHVRFWITDPDGRYWGWTLLDGWHWDYTVIRVRGDQVNDTLWRPRRVPTLTMEGTYTMFVRAWDANGNMTLNAWSWTLTVSGEFITIEALPADPGRDWYFTNEHFTLRTIAWSHPGVPDVDFAHEFVFGDNMPLPEDFEIVTPGPYYAFRGTLEVEGVCHPPVLGLEAFVDAPSSGLPRASTDPIDVIQLIDDDLGGFVMDNPDDQGNWMWLHHNRTTQDPDYTGPEPIDTTSVKIVAYHYFRDIDLSAAPADTDWQPLVIVGNASDGDSVRLEFGNANTFTEYDYSMIVEVQIVWLGDILFTDRISLGSERPHDNIPPQTVGDVAIGLEGGAIRLDWPEARLGSDLAATPEIDPEINVVYDVYRFTDPEAVPTIPTWSGVPDTFLVDAGGSGDITTPYYYSVKARDYESQESPDYTGYVGEVDYGIGVGWNAMAYPLPVTGLVAPADYIARLGVPLGDMYAYANPPSAWEEIMVGGTPFRNLSNTGEEDLLVYSPSYNGIATWTGKVPADLSAIDFDLASGFNGIMIPLDRGDLTMASDLYDELDGMGLDPVTVARMVPGVGWDDIAVIGGSVYFDFPIYPGQAYLVWVDNTGTWSRSAARTTKSSIPMRTSDVVPMPKSIAIPVVAEDGAEVEDVVARAIWGKQAVDCAVDGGVIKVELSRFDNIETGNEIRVEISAEGGAYVGQTTVTVDDGPMNIAKSVTLSKVAPTLPKEFALRANVPNPFNPATSIAFDLPEDAQVRLSIYNINGHLVRTVVDSKLDAGYHHVVWDGRDNSGQPSPAGVYFYTIRANDFTAQRRMMLVK
ncbi:T9SS type A sorting domain-containing protein, partial [bacterium]|nr:T9SS type A sorting domain-containing protein [bacterium]